MRRGTRNTSTELLRVRSGLPPIPWPLFSRCGTRPYTSSICWIDPHRVQRLLDRVPVGMVFGRYLRIRRRRARLGLRPVAKALGIAPNYLDQVETGTRPPFGEDRWPALVKAVPGITWEGLTWATVADTGDLPIANLNRRQRFAIVELLTRLRVEEDLPENFDPSEAQEEFCERIMAVDAPPIADSI